MRKILLIISSLVFITLSTSACADSGISYNFQDGQRISQPVPGHELEISETVKVGYQAQPFTCYVTLQNPSIPLDDYSFFIYKTKVNSNFGTTYFGEFHRWFYDYKPTEIVHLCFSGKPYKEDTRSGDETYSLLFEQTGRDLYIVCKQNVKDPNQDGFLIL